MKKKIGYVVLVVVLILLILVIGFYFFNKFSQNQSLKNRKLEKEELMAIIKKSPDYPEFLRIIKANNFEGEVTEYYYFSPSAYQKKKEEWEQNKNEEMKEMEEIFNTLELNENCYLVRLKSKTKATDGLLAVIDAKKKEPLVIVAEIAREMGAGM